MRASVIHPASERPGRGNLPGLAGCVAFVIYTAFLLATIKTDPQGGDGMGLTGQAAGIGAVLLLNLACLPLLLARLREGAKGSSVVFYVFWAAMLALLPFGQMPLLSFVYIVLTVLVYVCLGSIWLASGVQRRWMAAGASVLCYGFCLRAMLTYDLGTGRGLGAVVPNTIGTVAITPVLLSFLLGHAWLRGLTYVAGLGIAGYVGARGSLCSLAIYVFVQELALIVVHRRWVALVRTCMIAAIGVPILAAGMMISRDLREAIVAPLVEVMALDSKERGLHSGLTGRSAHWGRLAQDVEESFVTGIGFRAAKSSTTHSAFLDLVREAGAIGTLLFVGFVALRLLQLTRTVFGAGIPGAQREMAAGVLAGMCAVLFLANFEQMLLNVGFPIGACALLYYAYQEPLPSSCATPEHNYTAGTALFAR
jgi:hypothetical protein